MSIYVKRASHFIWHQMPKPPYIKDLRSILERMQVCFVVGEASDLTEAVATCTEITYTEVVLYPKY